jgi:hypothetical protein
MPAGPTTSSLDLKATASAYVVLGIIFGFLTGLTALAAAAQRNMRWALLACIAAWAVSYVWLFRFRLVVSSDSLSYTSLFCGTRVRRLTDIKNIKLESGIREYSDRFKPLFRLVVVSVRPEETRININLKVLAASSVRELLETLRARYKTMGMTKVVRGL